MFLEYYFLLNIYRLFLKSILFYFRNYLFSQKKEKITSNVYLLPEFKKVNYFLKIENTNLRLIEILSHLNSIHQIATAYVVDVENLKSKNNLIF